MTNATTTRSLRDRPLGRLLILAVMLVVAALAARSCADTTPEVSQDAAIETARSVAKFEPEGTQIRFLRQGIPSVGVWAVSMYQGTASRPTRVQLVIIDAETGTIIDEDR